MGDKDKECSACKSLHFSDEYKSKGNTYDSCCPYGKFVENKFNDFSPMLKELSTCGHEFSTSFHENTLRGVNNAFAFGSVKGETVVTFPSESQCFKVHGQIYHLANTSPTPNINEVPFANFVERIFTNEFKLQVS